MSNLEGVNDKQRGHTAKEGPILVNLRLKKLHI